MLRALGLAEGQAEGSAVFENILNTWLWQHALAFLYRGCLVACALRSKLGHDVSFTRATVRLTVSPTMPAAIAHRWR